MGKAFSSLKRLIRNFDIEHRTMKYLDRYSDKPLPAPKHPGTAKVELNKEDLTRLFSTNPDLDQRVNQFSIQSHSIKEGILPKGFEYVKESTRRLPKKFDGPDPFPEPHIDFGFVVPESTPVGRLTMRQAVSLVKSYQLKESSIEELAQQYNLKEETAKNIVEYFLLFTSPSKGYMVPPHLTEEIAHQNLLDEPIAARNEDDIFYPGGAERKERLQALQELKKLT